MNVSVIGALARNTLGHFHPAIVHFPVAFLLGGAALEAWRLLRKAPASDTGRTLLVLGAGGALLALASGLALFHPGDFGDRVLAVALLHRLLGVTTASLAVAAVLAGTGRQGARPEGRRLALYRLLYALTALAAGMAGHYGGWVVFGWGKVWTP